MNKERIDDLVDILSEREAVAENTLLIRNQQELLKYIENPTQWKTQQLNNLKNYKKEVLGIAKSEMADIKQSAVKVYLVGYKEVDKDSIQITKTEISAKVPLSVKQQADDFADKTAEEILKLADLAVEQHQKNINIIGALATPDTLYDVIKQQMEKGVDNGMPVTYADGKTFSWKAYMEMKTRTVIKQEIVNNQAKMGAKLGIVFYMCDVLGDSADDHEDFQGKVYYNADAFIPDNVQEYIDANDILSMQEVMLGDPFLTTRPNCRHNFHAVPTQDVLIDTPKEILDNYGLVKGEYKEQNYGLTQQQRLNERTIRKYKTREQTAQKLYQATGDKTYLAKAQRAGAKVKEWQKRNRELIAKHPDLLERDARRESLRVITGDLGVKYDYTFDKGTGNPTPTPPPKAFATSVKTAEKVKQQGAVPTPPVPVSADTTKTLEVLTPLPVINGSEMLKTKVLNSVYSNEKLNNGLWIKATGNQSVKILNNELAPKFLKLFNNDLTEKEREAIVEYTGANYAPINAYERANGDLETFLKLDSDLGRAEQLRDFKNNPYAMERFNRIFKNAEEKAKLLESIFDKPTENLKSDKDMWVQRGINATALYKLLGIPPTDNDFDNENYIIRNLQKFQDENLGKTYVDEAFVSTSAVKGGGMNKNVILNIFVPQGTKHIYANPISIYGGRPALITRKTEVKLEELSTNDFASEKEVILNRGLKYHITKITTDTNGIIYLDVEVIND